MLLYFINFHNRQHIYTEIKDVNSSFRMEMHNREKFESLLNFPVAVFFSSNEKRNFGHNDLFAVQPIRTKIDICSPLLSSINARFFMGRLESIYVFSLVYIKTLFCACMKCFQWNGQTFCVTFSRDRLYCSAFFKQNSEFFNKIITILLTFWCVAVNRRKRKIMFRERMYAEECEVSDAGIMTTSLS